MIECVFTLDYEIYGNGEGSLRELVHDPAERLMATFRKWDARFVPFVEVAELEIIETEGSDPAIELVKRQIRDFYKGGFQLGLHLHPQWYNARYENGKWLLDYSEYNLCVLPRVRIANIIDRSIAYLRNILGVSDFTPLSFRAGNWLLQPTETVAAVLAEKGIKIDSSVFKGGVQRNHQLDYRPALRNGYYWRFQNDVNISDPDGALVEIPTYAVMVPFWRMLTAKRVGLQRKSHSTSQKSNQRMNRILDYLRLWYPLKFDFCRMTINELTSMMDRIIREDEMDPTSYKPIVAIGHTKDMTYYNSVEYFLSYIRRRGIAVSTFEEIYRKCKC